MNKRFSFIHKEKGINAEIKTAYDSEWQKIEFYRAKGTKQKQKIMEQHGQLMMGIMYFHELRS